MPDAPVLFQLVSLLLMQMLSLGDLCMFMFVSMYCMCLTSWCLFFVWCNFSASCILCALGCIPSPFLHGARDIRQWLHDKWCCCRSRYGCRTQYACTWCQRCCEAPAIPQGQCQEGHVLLLSNILRQGLLLFQVMWRTPSLCFICLLVLFRRC